MLATEEYVEQGYFFRSLRERLGQHVPMQEMLVAIKEEILATTKLPLAIDYLASELRHQGVIAPAFAKLSHYFTPFQGYLVSEAEHEEGRFDLRVALEILEREAAYRAEGCTPQGVFLYEFEALCRNRLRYERGLEAIAGDPIFDDGWKQWIRTVRRQIGIVDFADLIYVRSEAYRQDLTRRGVAPDFPDVPVLFGAKEGKICRACRQRDPLYLFAALHRQLKYPAVPRMVAADEATSLIPRLARQMERLEHRVKLLEEEQRGGIDLQRFLGPDRGPPAQ
jgi:hypothetical protein